MPIIQQRSLSIYTLFGAIQSAVWFFVLPSLIKPYWAKISDNYTNQQAEVLLWAIGAPYMLLYMLVAALPPYFILRNVEWVQQYKISRDPWPWSSSKKQSNRDSKNDDAAAAVKQRQLFWKQTYKSILLDVFGLFVFIPTLVCIKTIVWPTHVMSFSMEDFPTPSIQSATTLLSMGIIHEFGFYWTHRLMHMYPSLYKYHKVHHEYKQNNVLSAQHFHPIDFLISIALPAILTTEIVRPHGFAQLQFGLWLLTANFDDHLGYAFPWAAVRWFPWSAGTDAHEYHHSVNMGCYGSKLSLWDWVFGTDNVYNEWRKKRWSLVD